MCELSDSPLKLPLMLFSILVFTVLPEVPEFTCRIYLLEDLRHINCIDLLEFRLLLIIARLEAEESRYNLPPWFLNNRLILCKRDIRPPLLQKLFKGDLLLRLKSEVLCDVYLHILPVLVTCLRDEGISTFFIDEDLSKGTLELLLVLDAELRST